MKQSQWKKDQEEILTIGTQEDLVEVSVETTEAQADEVSETETLILEVLLETEVLAEAEVVINTL
jgi:hypothetical protein